MGRFTDSLKLKKATTSVVRPDVRALGQSLATAATRAPAAPSTQPAPSLPSLAELNKVEPAQRFLPNLAPQGTVLENVPQQQVPVQTRTTPLALLPLQATIEGTANIPANVAKGAQMGAYGFASILPRAVQAAAQPRGYAPPAAQQPQTVDQFKQQITEKQQQATRDKFNQKAQGVAAPQMLPYQRKTTGEQTIEASEQAVKGVRSVLGTPDLSTAVAKGLWTAGSVVPSLVEWASPTAAVSGPLSVAGSAARQAADSGATLDQQFVNATAAGALAAALRGFGASREAGALTKQALAGTLQKQTVKDALKTLVKTGVEEGSESVVEQVVNNIMAQSTYAPDTKIVDPAQLAEQFATGFLAGGLSGVPRIVAGAIASKNPSTRKMADDAVDSGNITPEVEQKIAEAVAQDRKISEIPTEELTQIVRSAMPEIEKQIRAEQQREFNEAYYEWDQTVNDFDERGTTPQQRAEWRKSVEPVLERYTSAEEALNKPIDADDLVKQMAYGTAPAAVFDAVSRRMNEPSIENAPTVEQTDAKPKPQAEEAGEGPSLQFFGNVEPGPTAGKGPTVESKLSENIRAGRVGNATVTEAFKNDPMTHRQLTMDQTIDAMNERMKDYDGSTQSLDKIYNSWADRIQNGENMNTGDIPLVRVLANEYEKAGMSDKAEQAYAIAAEAALTYGRYVNAFKYIYDKMDPKRVVEGAQKIVDKINTEGEKRYGKKWTDLELTKEEKDAFANLKTMKDDLTKQANAMKDGVAKQEALNAIPGKLAEEQAKIMEGVTDRWANIVPSTAIEKWNYWRRFAMLTSPKTHIRNIVSNTARAIMECVKDTVATGLERVTFTPKEQRLHSAGWMFNKPVMDAATKAWADAKPELTHTIKYEIGSLKGLERKVKPLGKAVGTASDAVMNMLEAEDVPFMRMAFQSSLAQQMQARGVTEPTAAMIQRAKNVALENTYKLMNGMSEMLNDAKKNKSFGTALDALLPFTRTPAAVAKTALEFTPVLGTIQMGRDLKRGRITNRAEAIDAISKQVVGGGLLALGYFMAKSGLAFGEDEKSAKAKEMQQLGGGRQAQSVKVGDGTFTIDWMQPTSSPFLIGVQLYNATKDGGSISPSTITGALTSTIDTFFDQSMLSGVGQLFKADDKGEAALNLGVDYILQGIPVLYTQIAKAASGAERSSYDSSMAFPEKVGARLLSKTFPWMLPKKSDVLGGDKTQGQVADILNAIVSPGFYKKQSDDPAAAELYRLHKERGGEDGTVMLPKTAPTRIGDLKLTPEQRIQFTREYGLEVQKRVTDKIDDPGYVNATDEQKVKAIKALMESLYNQQKAKMSK